MKRFCTSKNPVVTVLFAAIASLFFFLGTGTTVSASEESVDSWYNSYRYELYENDHEIHVSSYNGNATELTVPAKAVIDGFTYNTVISSIRTGAKTKTLRFERGVKTDSTLGIVSTYLETVDLSNLDTSNLTNLSRTFNGCTSLKNVKLNGINTRSVTDFSYMFSQCSSLESIDLSGLNTSSATTMEYMFSGCTNLKSLDLRSFNTTNLKKIDLMFMNCRNLKDLNLSSFDLTNLSGRGNGLWQTTNGCDRMERIWTPTNLKDDNYHKWRLPNAMPWVYVDETGTEYKYMPCSEDSKVSKLLTIKRTGELSRYTYTLTTETDASKNKLTVYSYVGNGGDLHIPAKFTINGVPYNTYIGENCYISNVKKVSFERGVTISRDYTFCRCEFEEIDFTGVNNTMILSIQHFLSYNPNLRKVTWGDFDITGSSANPIKAIEFLVGFCPKLTELDLSSFDTGNMTYLWEITEGCDSLEVLNLSGCDFKNFRTDSSLFMDMGIDDCKNLKYIYTPIHVPASGKYKLPGEFVDEDGEFYNYLPVGLDESIKLYSVENTDEAMRILYPPEDTTWQNDFEYLLNTDKETGRKAIRIKKYTGMQTDNLKIPCMAIVDGKEYNTEIAKDCIIKNVKKLSFERGVTIVDTHTFAKCDFEEIDLTGVQNATIQVSQHFLSQNSSLKKVTWGDFSLTGNPKNPVKSVEYMFYNCTNLKEIDFSSLDTRNMIFLCNICDGCASLETVNLAGCDFSSITAKDPFFWQFGLNRCENLKYVIAPVRVPDAVHIPLPGYFADEKGKIYDYLPTGLSSSIKLYSVKNTAKGRNYAFGYDEEEESKDLADETPDENSKTQPSDDEEETDDENKAVPEGTIETIDSAKYEVRTDNAVSIKGTTKKKKTVKIPASVSIGSKTYKVTAIDASAYKGNKKLTKVVIGANVESIGSKAFRDCKKLKNITIYGNNLKSIAADSFEGIKKGANITIICKNKKTFNKLVKMLKKSGAKSAYFKYKKG